jgi:hypothetical protein
MENLDEVNNELASATVSTQLRSGTMTSFPRCAALALSLSLLAACALEPQDIPWEPLSLEAPIGMTTGSKLASLRTDPTLCFATLDQSRIEYARIEDEPVAPECSLESAIALERSQIPYSGAVRVSCALAAALYVWEREIVQPAAEQHLGAQVSRIDQIGTYACRRIYGRETGRYSEHAMANAIDVAGFRLADGRRVSVLEDWTEGSAEARFLRAVREGGCDLFRGVLSPDYNAAHADHLHLDMGPYDICS